MEKSKSDENIIFIVDRFEGEYAICQNYNTKEMIEIKINELPEKIKEGTYLRKENNTYIICSSEEDEKRISEKMNRLFRKK